MRQASGHLVDFVVADLELRHEAQHVGARRVDEQPGVARALGERLGQRLQQTLAARARSA
jgi:hypothetical protein